jgi:hypothetical protein
MIRRSYACLTAFSYVLRWLQCRMHLQRSNLAIVRMTCAKTGRTPGAANV